MRNPIWPISLTALSLIVIGVAAYVLHGPIHPDYLPRHPQPLVLKGLREHYFIPAGLVIVFGILAIAHARTSRYIKWLYLLQLAAGALFLAILVASGLQARNLFLNGPPPPEWIGPGESPESVKSGMK